MSLTAGVGAAAVAATAVATSYARRRRRRRLAGTDGPAHFAAMTAAAAATAPAERSSSTTATRGSGDEGEQHRSRFRARQAAERVVCCPSTKEYLATIQTVVARGDRVLVIGRRSGSGGGGGGGGGDGGGGGGGEESESEMLAARLAGGADRVVRYSGALWDVRALHALGSDFAIVCVEAGDIFGNDVVCDGQAHVRLVRSVFGGADVRQLQRVFPVCCYGQ